MDGGNTLRGRVRAAALVLCTLAFASGCGDTERQKPKVISFVPEAAAQTTDLVVPPAAVSGATMQPVDEAFALFAASSGLAEVEAARLVLKASPAPEIRDYAERIAKEHGRSVDELRRIAAGKGLNLPPGPTGRHLDMVTKLSGVHAQELGEAFLRRFGVDAHKETIALFERHVSDGKDPQLKRYAEQTLAALREHLNVAQKLLNAIAGR